MPPTTARITHYGAGSGLANAPTIATRLEDDYRAELVDRAGSEGTPYSAIVRSVVKGYLDLTAGTARRTDDAQRLVDAVRGAAGLDDLDLTAGTARADDPATAREAARLKTAPRARTGRAEALEVIAGCFEDGMTTDEVIATLEHRARHGLRTAQPAYNGVAKRVSELLHAGAIEEARVDLPGSDTHGRVRTRRTRHGRDATVYVATDLGRRWLETIRG